MTHETANTASKLPAQLTFMEVRKPLCESGCWKSSFQQRYLIAGQVQPSATEAVWFAIIVTLLVPPHRSPTVRTLLNTVSIDQQVRQGHDETRSLG